MLTYKKELKMSLHQMEWGYFRINQEGRLVDENGYKQFSSAPDFATVEEAEQWLVDNDERGTVTGFTEEMRVK